MPTITGFLVGPHLLETHQFNSLIRTNKVVETLDAKISSRVSEFGLFFHRPVKTKSLLVSHVKA